MTKLLSGGEMRRIERAAIDAGEVSGLTLMERAGRGVVEAVFEAWPELAGRRGASPPHPSSNLGPNLGPNLGEYLDQKETCRAVVLCGPGNNGGDGFVVARLLAERGWLVEVYLMGDAARLLPDARANFERWRELGEVKPLEAWRPGEGAGVALVVDALFGTGLTRPFDEHGSLSLEGPRIVAVDVPSGICADSGRWLGDCPEGRAGADLTVAFHAAKRGHYLADGPVACGRVVVCDIGLNAASPDTGVTLVQPPKAGLIGKGQPAHKYAHGHALILSGPPGKGGAGRLAARGALRIGAGLVTLGCPPQAMAENAARLDAVMLTAVHDGDAFARVLADGRINALCLGPGLGIERAGELTPVALASGRRAVLDADALSAFGDDPEGLFADMHDGVVLTPHGGEFARLFPDLARRLDDEPMSGPACSKVDAVRAAAARAGCVVLLKGPDTVIAAPDGRAAISSAQYERSAPWLATAGSGDVLAGFITGLLARGLAPFEAAETAAWLHVDCALSFGPGLIAEDLPDELPPVFRALGL